MTSFVAGFATGPKCWNSSLTDASEKHDPPALSAAEKQRRIAEANAFMYPLQGLAAWIFPGAGHLAHGQRTRGFVLMITILLLWAWGWLIGGVSAFDRREHPFWFGCQAMTAPSFVATLMLDWRQPTDYQGRRVYSAKPPPPSDDAPYEPSYGRSNELGILFTALAGLLNLLAIVDAGLHGRRAATHAISPNPAQATQAATSRWTHAWPRFALAAAVLVGVGLAVPLRSMAATARSVEGLSYRPFIDPMPWNDAYWILTIVPLSLAVAVVYRSVRTDDMSQVPRQAVIFTAQIVGSMVAVALIVWAITKWI